MSAPSAISLIKTTIVQTRLKLSAEIKDNNEEDISCFITTNISVSMFPRMSREPIVAIRRKHCNVGEYK